MAIFDIGGNTLVPDVYPETTTIQLTQIGWYYGYISNSDGTITYDNNRTCVCPQFIHVKAGAVISASDSYCFSVAIYSNSSVSSYVSRSALGTSSYTIANDCYIRLHLAKPSSSENLDIDDFAEVASHISCSKPLLIINRNIYKDIIPVESYTKARDRFMRAVNAKAQQIGMTNSIFVDPAGHDTATNRVTAKDMVRMGIEALSYNELCRVWQTTQYTFNTLDPTHREVICEYGDDISVLDSEYMLLGKKNGYMPLTGSNKIFTMVAVCRVEGRLFVGAIGFSSTVSVTTGRAQRVPAMKELMDNVKLVLNGGSAQTPTKYDYGAAAEVPIGNVASYEKKDISFICTYNADTKFVPASCTKVITAMTMLDWIADIHDKIEVISSDDPALTSGDLVRVGDIVNYEQALYLMMLPSNGLICRTIARTLGEKMIVGYD